MRFLILASIVAFPSVLQSQIITERAPTTTTSPTVYAGNPPKEFRVSSSSPASVSFAWTLAYGVSMQVLRSTGAGQPFTNLTPTPLPANAMTFTDPTVDYRQSYVYRLQVNYGTGYAPGYADIAVTIPQPANPAGFTAKQTGEGTAELSWQAVPNASYYWIWGPGTGTEGVRADGTTKTLTGTGSGPKEWMITTRYDPAGVLLPQSSWPKTSLIMVSRSANYRITLNGFQVVSPASEVVTLDGAGNEVFAVSYVRVYDRNTGAVLKEGSIESAVHGDTEGFGGRVPAGSMKSTGGLKLGDKFPGATPWVRGNSVSTTTFPLLLWEGPLTDATDAVVVTPTIWEWQGDANTTNRKKVDTFINGEPKRSTTLWPTVSAALSESQSWSGPTLVQMGLLPEAQGGTAQKSLLVDLFDKDENITHAIGADVQPDKQTKQYYVKNMGLVFTRELIEKALNSSSQVGGMGPGIIEVKWVEKYPGATGSYTLYVQVARQ